MRPNVKFAGEGDHYSQLYFRKDDVSELLVEKSNCILLIGVSTDEVSESDLLQKVLCKVKERNVATVVEINRGDEVVLDWSVRIVAEPVNALQRLLTKMDKTKRRPTESQATTAPKTATAGKLSNKISSTSAAKGKKK